MSFIRLTEACQFFTVCNEENDLILTWNSGINFIKFTHVSFIKFQFGPIKPINDADFFVVHSNIIARTLHNPLREVLCQPMPEKSYIDKQFMEGKALNLIGSE